MAAETEKGSGKLSGRALAKGRENGGHLPVALEGWVVLVVGHIPWLFHLLLLIALGVSVASWQLE